MTPSTESRQTCKNGHDLQAVGIYRVGAYQRCKTCHRDGIRDSRARANALRGHPESILYSEVSRFESKIQKSDHCWEWLAGKSKLGYGLFSIAGSSKLAHRVSYRHYVGEIPEDRELDHLCRNRSCVSPSHLEPVTHRENVERAFAAKTDGPYRPHGSTARYRNGCRCLECKSANADAVRQARSAGRYK